LPTLLKSAALGEFLTREELKSCVARAGTQVSAKSKVFLEAVS
jgi:hypothetical protein